MSVEGFRCKNCGAPLDVSPDTIAVVCSYCGYLNWVREDLKEEVLIVEPMSDKDVLKKLNMHVDRKNLGDVFNESTLASLTFVSIPYYFVDVSAEADYSGRVVVYVRRCRRKKDQEECWTESRSVYVSGVYGPFEQRIPVIARRASQSVSLKALANKYMRSNVNAIPIEKANLGKNFWSGLLSIEIDKKTAMDIAINVHLNKLRELVTREIKREAESRVRLRGETVIGSNIVWKRITPMNVKASSSKPILLPMYITSHRYGNEIYRAVLSGWDGDLIVLEKPMKIGERVLWGLAATLSAGILGGLGIGALGVYGFPLLVIGSIASWYGMRKALAPVKTKVFGEGAIESVEKTLSRALQFLGE